LLLLWGKTHSAPALNPGLFFAWHLTKTWPIFYKILGVILLTISGQGLTNLLKVDVEQCSYAELVGPPKRGCGG